MEPTDLQYPQLPEPTDEHEAMFLRLIKIVLVTDRDQKVALLEELATDPAIQGMSTGGQGVVVDVRMAIRSYIDGTPIQTGREDLDVKIKHAIQDLFSGDTFRSAGLS